MNDKMEGYIILSALSDYLPVMTEAEIAAILNGRMRVSVEMVCRWEEMLSEKVRTRQSIFEAYAKQR